MAACVVVMGVSGCGKSTVGAALATQLKVRFVEGDSLHPARNVALMAAGTPLTDADRWAWLQAVADELAQGDVVASCSALKRHYRDLLRASAPQLQLVHLHGTPALLAARLQARSGHYMPAAMLQSQLDTLEPPDPDEHAIQLDVVADPDALVQQLSHQLTRQLTRQLSHQLTHQLSHLRQLRVHSK